MRNESFGLKVQPEVVLPKFEDGFWEVKLQGFDYFDTKTGKIKSGDPTQVIIWSLGQNCSQRSLMLNQIFFPMDDSIGGWI